MTSCAHLARSKSIDLENCDVVFLLLPRLLFFFPVPTPWFAVRAVPSLSHYCGAVFPPPCMQLEGNGMENAEKERDSILSCQQL